MIDCPVGFPSRKIISVQKETSLVDIAENSGKIPTYFRSALVIIVLCATASHVLSRTSLLSLDSHTITNELIDMIYGLTEKIKGKNKFITHFEKKTIFSFISTVNKFSNFSMTDYSCIIIVGTISRAILACYF